MCVNGIWILNRCKPGTSVVGPVRPEPVEVEVRYQRVDDTPDCPRTYFGDDPYVLLGVYLQGFTNDTQMEKKGEDLFLKNLRVPVSYPESSYGVSAKKVYVLDYVFSDGDPSSNHPCRAHDMWFNNHKVPRDAIRYFSSGIGEYLLVRFDEDGVPYFE